MPRTRISDETLLADCDEEARMSHSSLGPPPLPHPSLYFSTSLPLSSFPPPPLVLLANSFVLKRWTSQTNLAPAFAAWRSRISEKFQLREIGSSLFVADTVQGEATCVEGEREEGRRDAESAVDISFLKYLREARSDAACDRNQDGCLDTQASGTSVMWARERMLVFRRERWSAENL